jgi:Txe/YoeB family toxin of Txe-Axe toxin-antitoxin module
VKFFRNVNRINIDPLQSEPYYENLHKGDNNNPYERRINYKEPKPVTAVHRKMSVDRVYEPLDHIFPKADTSYSYG